MRLIILVVLSAYAAYAACGQAPNRTITPGAVRQSAITQVCATGYSFHARHSEHPVSRKTRSYVLREYGITANARGYVIDHLIPLELGGSNTVNNLWPQRLAESRQKDWLENRLRREACAGNISLQQAQREIANDWVKAYADHMGK